MSKQDFAEIEAIVERMESDDSFRAAVAADSKQALAGYRLSERAQRAAQSLGTLMVGGMALATVMRPAYGWWY